MNERPLKRGPGLKKELSSSNHQFSGDNMQVSFQGSNTRLKFSPYRWDMGRSQHLGGPNLPKNSYNNESFPAECSSLPLILRNAPVLAFLNTEMEPQI